MKNLEGITEETATKIHSLIFETEREDSFANKTEGLKFLEETYSPEKIQNWKDDYVLTFWNDKNSFIGFGRGKKDGWITHIYVAKEFQKKGYGTKILLALEEKLKQNGHTELFLNSAPRALDFYIRNGWESKVDTPIEYHGILLIPMKKKL